MKYTCKKCGWIKDPESHYMTSEDMQEIFEHEKICVDNTPPCPFGGGS